MSDYRGKTLLIVGGTGSFGNAVLEHFLPTDIGEILEIVRLVRETGLTYSMGETGIYRPAAIFCRRKYASGEMGEMVYAEAQYNHDMRHLYHTFRYTEGEKWRMMAGLPPFYYPTHSTSMVLSAAGTYAKKVSAFGYTDTVDRDIFGAGRNYWDNPFSNSSMMLQLANGAIARISENRRIAWNTPPTYISCFHGTKASYECSLVQHSYITMLGREVYFEDVSDLLNPAELTAHRGESGDVLLLHHLGAAHGLPLRPHAIDVLGEEPERLGPVKLDRRHSGLGVVPFCGRDGRNRQRGNEHYSEQPTGKTLLSTTLHSIPPIPCAARGRREAG